MILEPGSKEVDLHNMSPQEASSGRLLSALATPSKWNEDWSVPKLQHSTALDGFRGLATCLIFQAHMPGGNEAFGQAGLGAFFVLAGFLLYGTLDKLYVSACRTGAAIVCLRYALTLRKILSQASSCSSNDHAYNLETSSGLRGVWQKTKRTYAWIVDFQLARAARLLPAQICMVVITSVYMHLRDSEKWSSALLTRSAVRALFWSEDYSSWASPFHQVWSLSFQEWSYLLLCITMPLVPKNAQKKRLFWSTITIIFFAISLVLALFQSTSFPFAGETYLGFPLLSLHWRRSVLGNIWKICLGATIRTMSFPTWVYRQNRMSGALALGFVGYVWWFNLSHVRGGDTSDAALGPKFAFFNPVAAFLTCAIILTSLEGNWLLEADILRFVGRLSYAAYLWHFTLAHIEDWPWNWHEAMGVLLSAIIAAYCSTIFVEEPIIRTFKRWQSRRLRQRESVRQSRSQA